jgi:hypothetical protein
MIWASTRQIALALYLSLRKQRRKACRPGQVIFDYML